MKTLVSLSSKQRKIFFSLAITSLLFSGCGGGDSTPLTPSGTSGVAVDPYIVGATFYYDANNNGEYDSGEAVSSATDSNGNFTFDVTIPDGGKVIMKDKGMHNGVPFDGEISAELSSSGIISPLTTLAAKGFTKTEIVNLLSARDINITEADITSNPMTGLTSSKTSATADELKNIQANVAVNTLLKIIDTNATKTQIQNNTAILDKTASLIKKSINPTTVGTANADVVLKTAIAISDFLVDSTIVNNGNTATLDGFLNDANTSRNTAITNLSAKYGNAANAGKQYTLNADGTASQAVQVSTTYDAFTQNNIDGNGSNLWTTINESGHGTWTWLSGQVVLEANKTAATETQMTIKTAPLVNKTKAIIDMTPVQFDDNITYSSVGFPIELDANTTSGNTAFATITIFKNKIELALEDDDGNNPTILVSDTNSSLASATDGTKLKCSMEVLDGKITFIIGKLGYGEFYRHELGHSSLNIRGIKNIRFDVLDEGIDTKSTKAILHRAYAQ